ncbi:MAG: hypothetical protein GY941_17620 [Planctomycetes bacterium]|nr:hypothetical protein [Planctomycetota bacterium]
MKKILVLTVLFLIPALSRTKETTEVKDIHIYVMNLLTMIRRHVKRPYMCWLMTFRILVHAEFSRLITYSTKEIGSVLGAIKENFSLNLQRIDNDGFSGFIRQGKRVMF